MGPELGFSYLEIFLLSSCCNRGPLGTHVLMIGILAYMTPRENGGISLVLLLLLSPSSALSSEEGGGRERKCGSFEWQEGKL